MLSRKKTLLIINFSRRLTNLFHLSFIYYKHICAPVRKNNYKPKCTMTDTNKKPVLIDQIESTASVSSSNNCESSVAASNNSIQEGSRSKRKGDRKNRARSQESINNVQQVSYNPNSVVSLVNLFHYFGCNTYTQCTALNLNGYNENFQQYNNVFYAPASFVYRNFSQATIVNRDLSRSYFRRHASAEELHHDKTNQWRTFNARDEAILSYRTWEEVTRIPGSDRRGFTFSLMSYNVLAQDLVDSHMYLYRSHNHKYLQWPERWHKLHNEIQKFSPDILCLQEVQGSHVNEFYSVFESLGYKGVYKQRTGIRTDGCAIYYKTEFLNLVEHATVEFNQPNISVLDRDNVAVIAMFSPKSKPSKKFVVATTHLLYNPRRQDVRLAQMQLLMTELERMAFRKISNGHCVYRPIILTGDLNSQPTSAVYNFITASKLNYEHLAARSLENTNSISKCGKVLVPSSLKITDNCQHAELVTKRQIQHKTTRTEEMQLIELSHSERTRTEPNLNKNKNAALFHSGTLSHNFAFKSVYDHFANNDIEGTTFQDEWLTVDYIFYSGRRYNNSIEEDKLQLLSRYKLPTKRQLGKMKIPNSVLGSDHLSLLAKFKLIF